MMTHCFSIQAVQTAVEQALPSLTACQAHVLGEWAFGMIVTQRQGISSVSTFLAHLFHQSENTVRQRLREWGYDAANKRGAKRLAVDVTKTFPELLTWVMQHIPVCQEQLVLVADATYLSNRMVVLAISVVIDGSAIPVAWHVQPIAKRGSWNAIWADLSALLAPATVDGAQVLLLTDRGLYSRDLFHTIVAHGWHPIMRINRQGLYETADGRWESLARIRPQTGVHWTKQGRCFKSKPLTCTLVSSWDGAAATPWVLITDLAPQAVRAVWYRMRMWIEQGFRHLKRGGWNWQLTRMVHAHRIARTWLTMAVATLIVVVIGHQHVPRTPPPDSGTESAAVVGQHEPDPHSVFRRGILMLLAALVEAADARFASTMTDWLALPQLKTYP